MSSMVEGWLGLRGMQSWSKGFFFTFLLSQHSGRSYCSRVCFNVTARARIGMTHTGSYNRGVNHTLSVCVCGHMSAPHQLRRCEQRTAVLFASIHYAAVIHGSQVKRKFNCLELLVTRWLMHVGYNDSLSLSSSHCVTFPIWWSLNSTSSANK